MYAFAAADPFTRRCTLDFVEEDREVDFGEARRFFVAADRGFEALEPFRFRRLAPPPSEAKKSE